MSGKKPSAARWTFAIPPEKCVPRGPKEAGLRAIGRLGPFQHKLQKDAAKSAEFGGRKALSEELAIEKVNSLAASYLRNVELSKGAPRIKDVLKNFEELRQLADIFATFLEGLDDFTRSYLQTAGSGIADHTKYYPKPMMKAADIEGLPLVAEEELYPRADSWVVRLRALRDYVEYSARNFMLAHGIENPDRPDKGGSSNLYKYLYGTPQWKLATDGRFVFEMFKPGQAKRNRRWRIPFVFAGYS